MAYARFGSRRPRGDGGDDDDSDARRARVATADAIDWGRRHVMHYDTGLSVRLGDPSREEPPGGDVDAALAAAVERTLADVFATGRVITHVHVDVHHFVVLRLVFLALVRVTTHANAAPSLFLSVDATVDPGAFVEFNRAGEGRRPISITIGGRIAWVTREALLSMRAYQAIAVEQRHRIRVTDLTDLVRVMQPGSTVDAPLAEGDVAPLVDAAFDRRVQVLICNEPPLQLREAVARHVARAPSSTVDVYVFPASATAQWLREVEREATRMRLVDLVAGHLPVVGVPEMVQALLTDTAPIIHAQLPVHH